MMELSYDVEGLPRPSVCTNPLVPTSSGVGAVA